MNTLSRLEVGYYGDLQRYPFHNPAKGGLDWSGDGRGCNTLTGWFVVDSVTYNGSTLATVDLRFEQHCEGGSPALHGAVHWDINDTTNPPGPVVPPPAGLWEPAAGVTPATGNYVYLESQPGDYIGTGGSYLYTTADSLITTDSAGARLTVSITGDENWGGNFQGMSTLSRLEVGYYGDLQRWPFHNPVKGGLDWSGEGRGCNTLTGWFVVDSVVYEGVTLAAIDLRFEQHCEGGAAALHGEIHWNIDDTTNPPPGPVVPPPAGLWEPAAGVTPATGNYVYLESQPGDFVGAGSNYLHAPADSQITIDSAGARLDVSIQGDESSERPVSRHEHAGGRLEVGYYGDLQRYPFHNPVKGGLSWTGEGRGCNTLTGWFVVDSVTYTGATLTAVPTCDSSNIAEAGCLRCTARFTGTLTTQRANHPDRSCLRRRDCGSRRPVLRRQPATTSIWKASRGITSVRAVTISIRRPIVRSRMVTTGARLNVGINGDESWFGEFQGMNTLSRLEVGYYGDLETLLIPQPGEGRLELVRRKPGLQHPDRLVRGRQRDLRRRDADRDRPAVRAALRRRGACAERRDSLESVAGNQNASYPRVGASIPPLAPPPPASEIGAPEPQARSRGVSLLHHPNNSTRGVTRALPLVLCNP